MAGSLACAAAAAILVVLPVQAAGRDLPRTSWLAGIDLKAQGFLTGSLSFDSNRSLSSRSGGSVYTSRTTAGLRLTSRGKRSAFGLNLGAGYYDAAGPGIGEGEGSFQPNIALNHAWNGRGYSISNGLRFSVRSTTDTQFEDAGNVEERLNQFTLNYTTGFSRVLDPKNSLAFNGGVRVVRFDEETAALDENDHYSLGGTWRRIHSRTTTLSARAGLGYYATEGNGTKNQTFNLTAGLDHRRTPRHRFDLSGGLTVARTDRAVLRAGTRTFVSNQLDCGPTEDDESIIECTNVPTEREVVVGVPGRLTEINPAFNGGLSFDYQLPRFLAGFDLSQGVDSGSGGEVRSLTRASGALRWRLTPDSSLSTSASYSRRSDFGSPVGAGGRNYFSFGPAFSMRLSEDVNLNLDYRFRLENREDQGVTGIGHRVMMSLSANFDIIE